MRIILIGANGTIGEQVQKALAGASHEIVRATPFELWTRNARETGLEETNSDFLKTDFWPGITSG